MKIKCVLLLLSLSIVLFGAVLVEAQAYQANAYPYSALYVDASQFCTGGFNAVLHTCINSANSLGSTGNTMWEAISAAIASPLNVSGVIDARAFQGPQIVKSGVGTTALYGCDGTTTCEVGGVLPSTPPGSQINGVLLLGNVTNYCDGPSTSNYTDGNSNYGTPCIIVPYGFQIVGSAQFIGSTLTGTTFSPCLGNNNPANSGCTTAFPQRSLQIIGISVSGTQMIVTVSNTLQTSLGPTHTPPQNIYPGPMQTGELVAITGAPTGDNVLRTVQAATGTSPYTFTVSIPNLSGTSCTGVSCGAAPTAYLVTPLIGFGFQNNNGTAPPNGCNVNLTSLQCAYVPVRVGNSQSFATRLINLSFDLQGWQGAVAAQNLNGGEQSGMDTIYCIHPSMGCVQIGSGANESGPYNNIYVQTQTGFLTNVSESTFGIYNGSAGAGFHRFTMTSNISVTNHPTAAIYDDGPNVAFDGEPHNEGTMDTIDLAPNVNVAGVTINGILGPPCATSTSPGNPGTNLVHILKDGYTVSGTRIENLTQQQGGSCTTNGSQYAVADDIHSTNNVMDQFLSQYEFDSSGNPVSGATSQSNNAITTLNGSGAIVSAGGLTFSGSTTAATTIGTSNTNQNLTLAPNGSGKVVLSGTGGFIPANASLDLGAAPTPWRNLFLYGSGTFGSGSFEITGTPTGNDVLNLPNTAGGTDTLVAAATTQTLTNKSIAASEVNSGKLATANGGTNSANGAVTTVPGGSTLSGITLTTNSTVLQGMGTATWTNTGCSSGAEAPCEIPVPASGIFCGLDVVTDSNPPYTVTVTLRTGTNGSMSSTSLTCQLPTSGNTYCEDVAHTATATEGGGNVFDLQVQTGTVGTAASRHYYASVKICGAS